MSGVIRILGSNAMFPLPPLSSRSFLLALCAGAFAGYGTPCPAAPSVGVPSVGAQSDDEPETAAKAAPPRSAKPLIGKVQKAIGDYTTLKALAPFRFTFTVKAGETVAAERKTTWSPALGLARVELTTKSGKVIGAFETEGPRSVVENEGTRLTGAEAEKVGAQLEKTFRGDWNYFTLAHRLAEPSLIVTREDDTVEDGKTYARLSIVYDEAVAGFVGDRYGLLVDAETGTPRALFVKWKSMKPEQEPLRFDFARWQNVGAVRLPCELKGVGNPQTLSFGGIETKVDLASEEFLGLQR